MDLTDQLITRKRRKQKQEIQEPQTLDNQLWENMLEALSRLGLRKD